MENKNNFLEFAKPFIDAAKTIFETMVFTKLDPQKPAVKKDSISRGDISAVIGLTGVLEHGDGVSDYKGMLVISWPMETYLKVASSMLMEEFSEYNDDIADVGGEICNMIVGNAKRELGQMGYRTNMAIPSMVVGKDHAIKYPPGTTIIMIPMTSAHGPFYMEICYRQD